MGPKRLVLALMVVAMLGAGGKAQAQEESFNWVEIGDPGNPTSTPENAPGWDDLFGIGSVDYTFRMSAYETTNLQWAHFLNTVDPNGTNPDGVYSSSMASNANSLWRMNGGITFDNAAAVGSKYSVKSGYGLLPVIFVSWNDSARYVNWLHNGAGSSSSTETGVYDMSLPQQERVRMVGATYWLPNEDEWVKAAYYDPINQVYSLYPTQTDTIPNSRAPNNIDANSGNFYRDGGSGGLNEGYADPRMGDPSGTLYLTGGGTYELAASFYGTYDQGGNAWEWTERISNYERGLRGGSWSVGRTFMEASTRSMVDPTNEDEYYYFEVGFRVASVVPEPSIALLVLLGGAACWFIGRRRRGFCPRSV